MTPASHAFDSMSQNPTGADAVQVLDIFTYSNDGTPDGCTLFSKQYYTEETCYIGFKVIYNTAYHPRKLRLDFQVFHADGNAYTQVFHVDNDIPPNTYFVQHGTGWGEPNHWPAGKYYFLIHINGEPARRVDFEVCEGRHASFPGDIQQVRLFASNPPGEEKPPHYSNIFYGDSLRYVNLQLEFPAPGQAVHTFLRYRVCSPNGSWCTHWAFPVDIAPDQTQITASVGYGEPGQWSPTGTHGYEMELGHSNVLSGTFEVRSSQPSTERGIASAPQF